MACLWLRCLQEVGWLPPGHRDHYMGMLSREMGLVGPNKSLAPYLEAWDNWAYFQGTSEERSHLEKSETGLACILNSPNCASTTACP
jgi:hypothetical protein